MSLGFIESYLFIVYNLELYQEVLLVVGPSTSKTLPICTLLLSGNLFTSRWPILGNIFTTCLIFIALNIRYPGEDRETIDVCRLQWRNATWLLHHRSRVRSRDACFVNFLRRC